MKKLGRLLIDAFFPKGFTCDLCGIEIFEGNLCKECLKTVVFNDGATCPVCGRRTQRDELCLECKAHAPLYFGAFSPLVYEGGSIQLIAKFKNDGGYLKDYFAKLICDKISNMNFDCIVYVPMTFNAERKRGYNQAEILAKSISENTGYPVIRKAITKIKDTKAQKSLAFKERISNLKGCFKIEKPSELKDKSVLLVDDVLTTGATSETLCGLIMKAGAKSVWLATAASVEYKTEKQDNND